MDPPAMHSLIVELTRISRESSTDAEREGTPAALARAKRDARALAKAASAAFEAQG
jgi:hypothetical protein